MTKDISIDFDVELALRLATIVQEKCENVPRNIGIALSQEVVFLYNLEKAGKHGAEVGNALKKCQQSVYKRETAVSSLIKH